MIDKLHSEPVTHILVLVKQHENDYVIHDIVLSNE
jgi:hypothetical protein